VKILPGNCRLFNPGDGQITTQGTCATRDVVCRAEGGRHITQAVLEYAPGCSQTLVNPQAECVLYIVEGLGACRIDGSRYALSPGTAVFLPPGSEYSIENSGAGRILALASCCPEDAARHLVENPKSPSSPAKRLTVHETEREVVRAGKDREFRYLVHADLGCRQITQFVGLIPRGKAPFHFHEYEEVIYILQGRGIVHLDKASCEFEAGWSIYFPKGVRHCVENTTEVPIRLLGVFYPSGSPGAAYED
jgi:mannose-6-phosphate isomerase-like protein (cupin superfamily)